MTADNRDKFIYVAGQYNQRVKFYNVEKICADKIAEMVSLVPQVQNSRVSVGAFYRLLMPQLFSADIDKVIYLDSDIVVNMDINELWRVDLGEKVLGGVPELSNYKSVEKMNAWNPIVREGIIKAEDYFNTGVLLINVNVFRAEEELLVRGAKWRGENLQYKYFDQDILNYCFSTRTLKLPTKFNRFIRAARDDNEFVAEKKIYHYANGELQSDINDPFNRLWLEYFARTPWFDAETVGRLYTNVQQMHVGLKNYMIQISMAMSGKIRAFFTLPENIDALKEVFSVRNNEQIIRAESEESLNTLLKAMKKSRGKKIFFIMIPNFPFQVLIDAGFKPGEDFLNGMDFLSEAQGVPLNSYPLIQAM